MHYWNSLAASFERDVFDPVASDLHGTLVEALEELSAADRTVADLGCGTGRNLALLDELFRCVVAIDVSGPCLKVARERHPGLDDVEFVHADLSEPVAALDPVDVALCVNVAIMARYEVRMSLLRNAAELVRPGGRLLLVVPSLESVLLSVHRLVLWNLTEAASYREAAAAASPELGFTACSLRDGVVTTAGTPTKHYLREELELLIPEVGHRILRIEKVEYPWETEFTDPPEWMRAPYPWDWLVLSEPKGEACRSR